MGRWARRASGRVAPQAVAEARRLQTSFRKAEAAFRAAPKKAENIRKRAAAKAAWEKYVGELPAKFPDYGAWLATQRTTSATLTRLAAQQPTTLFVHVDIDVSALLGQADRADAAAERRDRVADARDHDAHTREQADGTGGGAAGADRMSSAVDRWHSGSDRDRAAGERADLRESGRRSPERRDDAADNRPES